MATLTHLGTGLLSCCTKRHGCKFLLRVALAVAQDRVPAFSAAKAAEIVERDLGQPISKLFKRFDTRPIAAASLGQVGKRYCFERGARLFCDIFTPQTQELDMSGLLLRAPTPAHMCVPSS